jgi:hypothetical protein
MNDECRKLIIINHLRKSKTAIISIQLINNAKKAQNTEGGLFNRKEAPQYF